jgi:hypothetical protein
MTESTEQTPRYSPEELVIQGKKADTEWLAAKAQLEHEIAAQLESRVDKHRAWSTSLDKITEHAGPCILAAIVAMVPIVLIYSVYKYNTNPAVVAGSMIYEQIRNEREAARAEVKGLTETLRRRFEAEAPTTLTKEPNGQR